MLWSVECLYYILCDAIDESVCSLRAEHRDDVKPGPEEMMEENKEKESKGDHT